MRGCAFVRVCVCVCVSLFFFIDGQKLYLRIIRTGCTWHVGLVRPLNPNGPAVPALRHGERIQLLLFLLLAEVIAFFPLTLFLFSARLLSIERDSNSTSVSKQLTTLQAVPEESIASTNASGSIVCFRSISSSLRINSKRRHKKNTCSASFIPSRQDGHFGESLCLKRQRYARTQPCSESICVR